MTIVFLPQAGRHERDFLCQCLVVGRNVEKRRAFGKNRLTTGGG